ncbi:hypothetical protein NADRNF5_1548 [Nitrosopumilus adriaticus]|uniref:Uncharacterized protein n=1 Tax=Nitrosopumilus adriaticus TaxID=1580092 RepID=A0A0D5C340_9ARCH|nr:hypothetical protein NADRNF5_1548 [Nitrosopumilus adriaticus]
MSALAIAYVKEKTMKPKKRLVFKLYMIKNKRCGNLKKLPSLNNVSLSLFFYSNNF